MNNKGNFGSLFFYSDTFLNSPTYINVGDTKMQILANLQYKENYGFVEGKQVWKFKGGGDVLIPVGDNFDGNIDVEAILEFNKVIWKNEASEQYLLGWVVVPDDYAIELPDWLEDYPGDKEDYIKLKTPKVLKLPN